VKSSVALSRLFVAACFPILTGTLAAQSVHDKIGYTQLVAELGGVPGGGTATTYIRANDPTWRYRKGTSEASTPTNSWRLNGFAEDATWITGQTSVGYEDSDDNTLLSDMRGRYASVYLRHSFTVVAGKVPSRLFLRLYSDDGAIVWINGAEVARVRAGAGFRAFNALATGSVDNASWEEFRLENAGAYLISGTNLLAVHGFNSSLSSTDFSLDAELLMPPVTQVESPDSRYDGINKFLPFASPNPTPSPGYQFTLAGIDYGGTTIEVRSFPPTPSYNFQQSVHGNNVALRLFHNINSVAPDIERIHSYETNDWLNAGSLRTDLNVTPNIEHSFTQNHSWIATHSAANQDSYNRALRRYDFAAGRDNFLPVVGVNYWFPQDANPPAVPPFLSTAYHVLSVGLSDGRHSQGGTVTGYDGAGRMKPEIVAPESAPSYSTAVTTATVALLMELANLTPVLNSAMNIEAMKAIVLAGATKEEFPGWARTTTRPIDTVYGAGELNVRHSYRILTGGEQPAAPGIPVAFAGWDFDSLSAAAPKGYSFVVENNARLVQFSAFLTWHRQFTASPWTNDFGTAPTLPNLDLRLYTANAGIPVALVDSSVSTIDNIEHLYRLELPAGEYLLQATSNTLSDYGIAWRATPEALPPSFTLARGGMGVTVNLASIVVGVDYVIQRSTDLSSLHWIDVQTITASGPTASYLDTAGDPRAFYRVQWDLWK